MKLTELRDLAKACGIQTNKLSKIQLVRNIQRSEHNFDCFATAYHGECDQMQCRWRADCLDIGSKEALS